MEIIRIGNYIKKSTLNSETKEIVNIREFNEDTNCWKTDLGYEIPEYVLKKDYLFLNTGFTYTNSIKNKPLLLGDIGIDDYNESFNVENSFEEDEDIYPVEEEFSKNSSFKPQRSETEILFDSIIKKALLTPEKIINFKPKNNKKSIKKLSFNIQLDYDTDILINSCEVLDIDIKEFSKYLSKIIINDSNISTHIQTQLNDILFGELVFENSLESKEFNESKEVKEEKLNNNLGIPNEKIKAYQDFLERVNNQYYDNK